MGAAPRRKIGSYDVIEPLDEGGMGVVYLASQAELDREVVIKGLRRNLAGNRDQDERFRREAEAASRVHHQNVVAVYDCFVWRGERFIAQEYVDGADLAATLGVVHRFEPRVAGCLALELARGLEAIHERGIVHRDLKPANVLMGRQGEVKIADFGIALEASEERLTQIGYAVGTPPYMSPEQLLGERVDTRSDLFAFGVLLYEMLSGVLPFPEVDPENGEALIHRIQGGRYRPLGRAAPGTPRWLVRLVNRLLRAKPARRLASAGELRRALERKLRGAEPLQCRRELAFWLRERKVFEADVDETQLARPAEASRGWAPRLRGVLRAAAVLLLLGALGVGAVSFRPQLPQLPDASALPAVADVRGFLSGLFAEAEPAAVRFEATPWARVQVDDGEPFRVPTKHALKLAAGSHQIAFEHPEHGRVVFTVELDPGEERTLRHSFKRRR